MSLDNYDFSNRPSVIVKLRDQFCVNTKTVRFWKILLASTEKAY